MERRRRGLIVPPDDLDPLCWRGLGGVVWVVGTRLGGGAVVPRPASGAIRCWTSRLQKLDEATNSVRYAGGTIAVDVPLGDMQRPVRRFSPHAFQPTLFFEFRQRCLHSPKGHRVEGSVFKQALVAQDLDRQVIGRFHSAITSRDCAISLAAEGRSEGCSLASNASSGGARERNLVTRISRRCRRI